MAALAEFRSEGATTGGAVVGVTLDVFVQQQRRARHVFAALKLVAGFTHYLVSAVVVKPRPPAARPVGRCHIERCAVGTVAVGVIENDAISVAEVMARGACILVLTVLVSPPVTW